MADRRERDHKWYSSFDEKAMTLTLEGADINGEDLTFAAVYEVCGTCDGKGSHVNPSIDSHGLSREDFDEDPDFAEDYFSGAYDQPCNECHGKRVVPVAADDATIGHTTGEMVREWIKDHYDYIRECEAERRMGA